MDKKDKVTVILDKQNDKQVIGGYIFRGTQYLKEENETDKELIGRIKKEHPDFIEVLKEQKNKHALVAISLKGIKSEKKQDDVITVVLNKQNGKQEIIGYLFRGTQYLKAEKETHQDLCARIKKEHPDFMKLLKEQQENGKLKKTTAKKLEKKETNKNNTKTWKRVTAGLTVAATLLTGYIGYKHVKKYCGKKSDDITVELINNMSLQELITYLKEGKQKESFELMSNAQNNFNNNIASTITLEEDGDAKLYLTAEEMVALFAMANADTYTSETFYEIFDKSSILDASTISDNYTQAARVLWAYYSRATQKSGMAELFQDETNEQLVEQFEELIIKYNTSDNETKKKVKTEINDFFATLTDESKLDNKTKTNPEAVSYILTIGTSWAHANRLIDAQTKDRLVAINEVVTCDNLYNELKFNQEYVMNQEVFFDDKTSFVNKMPEAMNKQNQKTTNRDIEITFNGIEYAVSYPETNTTTNTNKTTTEVTTKQEITKEEAVEQFGKEEVEQKEQEAEEQVKEENKQEEINIQDFQNGYNAGYEKAYLHCATTGEKISTETTGTNKYKEGYQAGVNAGYIDGLVEYNAYLEAVNQATAPVRTR